MFSSTANIRKAIGEYILDEPLFFDSFSTIYRAFHVHTSQEALVRIIETSTINQIENGYQLMYDEVKLLQQFSHPNIIRIINNFSTRNNCYLIYEHCSGGSLETYVNLNRVISENETVKLIHEIIGGYGEFYRRNIVLKSIRLDSFVLHTNSIKFFDISIVKNFEKFKKGTSLKNNIKFWFSIAPEIYFGTAQSNKCDIWSLGLIFYHMLFGELPWKANNIEEFFRLATTQPPNFINKHQKVSKPTLNALAKMLQPDPAKRISYEDLNKEPLFVNYYDTLQEREQKLIEKIRKNPECWQAASMMYTSDPLISIFDLAASIKSSTPKKSTLKTVDDLKPLINQPMNLMDQAMSETTKSNIQPIWRIEQVEEMRKATNIPQEAQNGANYLKTTQQPQNNSKIQRQESGLMAFEKLEAEIKSLGVPISNTEAFGTNITLNKGNGNSGNNFAQTHSMNQSTPVIGKSTFNNFDKVVPKSNQNAPNFTAEKTQTFPNDVENEPILGLDEVLAINQASSIFNNKKMPKPSFNVEIKIGNIQSDLRQPGAVTQTKAEIQVSSSQSFSPEILGEFRKYTSRINYLCDFFQIYSQTASSAAKLFKTDMIIFQCFFLYKKLIKSLRVLYEAMAKGENVFQFKYWQEYNGSSHFFNAVEIIEGHLEKVEDIFDKIYKDCQLKLNEKKHDLNMMREYITDELEGIDTQLNSFLIPYLEKFLVSEEAMSDPERAFSILKHKIEVVNVLLLNKMPERNPEEVIVSLKEHKKIMKTEDINIVRGYFNQQYKKLDMFKLNNLKTII